MIFHLKRRFAEKVLQQPIHSLQPAVNAYSLKDSWLLLVPQLHIGGRIATEYSPEDWKYENNGK